MHHPRVAADISGHEPIAESAGAGPVGHVVLEVVPSVHDPEDRGMVDIAVIRHLLLRRAAARVGIVAARAGIVTARNIDRGGVGRTEDAGHLPWIMLLRKR